MRRILCVLIFMAMIAGAVLAVPRLGGVRQVPVVADPAAVDLNTTHRSSDGGDHTFIDQDVTSGSSPTLDGANFTGVDAMQDIFVHVDLEGDTQTLTDSTTEVVTFSNEVEDVGSNWDPVTHQFDVPVNGFYKIYAHYTWTGVLTDQALYRIIIRTNNTQIICDDRHTASGTGAQSQSISIELHLTTNHFVEFTGHQQGTGDGISGGGILSYAQIRLTRED